MSDPSKGRKVYFTISAVLLIPFAIIIAAQIRFAHIRGQVEKAAKEANPSLTYEIGAVPDSREDFFQALRDLAFWDNDTRKTLDGYFGTDTYMLTVQMKKPDGFANASLIKNYVRIDTWKYMREKLQYSDREAVEKLFDGQEKRFGVSKEPLKEFFADEASEYLVSVIDAVNDGDAAAAYYAATDYGFSESYDYYHAEPRYIPLDVAYSLDRKLLIQGCEQDIQEKMKSEDSYEIDRCLYRAGHFSGRFGLTIEGVDRLEAHERRLDYVTSRPVPEVGMTYDEACLTRLGEPVEERGKDQDETPRVHSLGDMSWTNLTGRVIFRAHYRNGTVESVEDLRQASGTQSKPYSAYSGSHSSGSGSSYSSDSDDFDPDDYDLDSYYDDYGDEYDDYDDAVDGLEDDPDRDDYLWD